MPGGDRGHHREAAVFAAGDQREDSVPHAGLRYGSISREIGLKFDEVEHRPITSCRFVLISFDKLTVLPHVFHIHALDGSCVLLRTKKIKTHESPSCV